MPRICHQLAYDLAGANRNSDDALYAFPRGGADWKARKQQVGFSHDAAEQITEVVCDTASHYAESFPFLPGEHLFLTLFKISNVDAGADVAHERAAFLKTRNSVIQHPSV